MADREHISQGYLFACAIGGSVSGSVLVDPDKAADVDIWVSNLNWNVYSNPKIIAEFGLEWYNPLEGTDRYEEAKLYMEIRGVLRSKKYNLNVIVVENNFVPAYVYGTQQLSLSPEKYQTKVKRANLFIEAKNRIHILLGNPTRPLQIMDGGPKEVSQKQWPYSE